QYAGLQAKMEQGVALSQSEMQQLSALAQSKMTYDATISGQQEQLQQAQLPYSQGMVLPSGSTYYVPQTGPSSAYNPFASPSRS
ncbi:MAG: hypothetical protein ACREQ5_17245, partial [Candidatus Dormibacteria bacterium]